MLHLPEIVSSVLSEPENGLRHTLATERRLSLSPAIGSGFALPGVGRAFGRQQQADGGNGSATCEHDVTYGRKSTPRRLLHYDLDPAVLRPPTPSAVGISRPPRPITVIAAAGTPSRTNASLTAFAHRSDSAML
jgi:hypothetical protein